MPEIKLQFVLSSDPSSRLIAWFSQGHFSHVDAVWARPNGTSLLGARSDNPGGYGRGVQVRSPGYVPFAVRVVATIPCTDLQLAKWEQFLREQIGKPYDMKAILAFFTNRNWREGGSWICSELQARALEVAGIVPKLYLRCNKITPVALALAVSAIPGAHFEQFHG